MLWRALAATYNRLPWVSRLLAAIYNRAPVALQRRVMESAHPRFLVGVHGLGIDPAGRVILARHRFGSSQWRLLGGFISRRESLQDALRREIDEETGLEIEVGPVLEANTGYDWARVEIVYAYRVIGGTPALTQELEELAAFELARLPDVRPDQRRYIERHAVSATDWARGRIEPVTLGVEVRR